MVSKESLLIELEQTSRMSFSIFASAAQPALLPNVPKMVEPYFSMQTNSPKVAVVVAEVVWVVEADVVMVVVIVVV